MCPTEKAVHRMLKKVLQNHSDSEENIEEWVIHFLFGSNKLSYRTAEHSNSRVTLALSSCEMDVTPETQDIYNSELWNPVYTLTKTYSLSKGALCCCFRCQLQRGKEATSQLVSQGPIFTHSASSYRNLQFLLLSVTTNSCSWWRYSLLLSSWSSC